MRFITLCLVGYVVLALGLTLGPWQTALTTPALIGTGLLLLLAGSTALVQFARLIRVLRPLLALCSVDVEGLAHELAQHPAGRFGRGTSAGSRT